MLNYQRVEIFTNPATHTLSDLQVLGVLKANGLLPRGIWDGRWRSSPQRASRRKILDTIWYNYIYIYGYGSIPINTIFSGMNIHLPAILMFTRGTRFWPTATYFYIWLVVYLPLWKMMELKSGGMMTFPTGWRKNPNVRNHHPEYIYI